jgi:hypothetical protein
VTIVSNSLSIGTYFPPCFRSDHFANSRTLSFQLADFFVALVNNAFVIHKDEDSSDPGDDKATRKRHKVY